MSRRAGARERLNRDGSPSAQSVADHAADDAVGELVRGRGIAEDHAVPSFLEAVLADLGGRLQRGQQAGRKVLEQDLEGVARNADPKRTSTGLNGVDLECGERALDLNVCWLHDHPNR